MSVEWIEYKGKRILFGDYRRLTAEELIEQMGWEADRLQEVPPPTRILILDNFEGATINMDVMDRVKEVGLIVEPRTEKNAIVGIHGMRHILLAAYNRVTGAGQSQKLFDTQEEALDWLVS